MAKKHADFALARAVQDKNRKQKKHVDKEAEALKDKMLSGYKGEYKPHTILGNNPDAGTEADSKLNIDTFSKGGKIAKAIRQKLRLRSLGNNR